MPKFKLTLILPILTFALTAQLFPQTPKKADTATVAGIVTLNGEPMRGVPVTLELQNPSTPSRNIPLRAKTDANGRFRITGVAAGQYFVRALALAFVSESSQNFGPQGKVINVSEGETVENLELTLKRGGVITGRITDSSGEPVVETNVRLIRIAERNPSGPPAPPPPPMNLSANRTDDRGIYRIFGLVAGKYKVSAGIPMRDGHFSYQNSRSLIPETFHPDTTDEAQAKVIEVEEGQEVTDVDIKTAEAKKAYEVSGRVVNAETGQPIAGVGLAFGAYNQAGRMSGIGSSSNWQTDVNGEFHVLGVSPGKFGVFLENREGKSEMYSDPTPVEVLDNDVTGVEVQAQRGASISGLVVIEGTSDPAVLARRSQIMLSTTPVPRTPTNQNYTLNSNRTIKVNPDGSFRFSGMPPSKVSLNSYSPMPGLSLLRVEQNGVPLKDSAIEIHAGEQVTGIRVVFGYGDGTVRGQVKIVGGELPEGIRILVGWRRSDSASNVINNTTPIDAGGQFTARNLIPGEYEFRTLPIVSGRPTNQVVTKVLPLLAKARQIVMVSNSSEAQVTITIDLSQENQR